MKKLLTACAFSMAAFLSAGTAHAQKAHGIAAVVNDDIVTTYDLQQRAMFMMATQGVESTEQAQQQILAQAMRNLVDEKLQIQEAKKFDQTISDQAVAQGVERLISRNNISVQDFANRLAQAGISMSTLQDQIRSEIAWQRIIGGLYGSRIRISDAQIDETLNRLTASANKPSYRVSEIYIEASPEIGGMNGAMQGANAMIEQLNQGAPFDILARQFSSSATSAKGGDVGWVRPGELREELDAIIVQLEKGQVSTPISVPGGVYVVAVLDTRVSSSETFYTLSQINFKMETPDQETTGRSQLRLAAAEAKSCETLKKDIESFDGVASNDMGEIKASDLSESILAALADTNVGELSEPIAAGDRLVSLMVCAREVRGSNIPSRDQVEDKLLAQQEAQASRRHLRNLRRDATIVTR